MIFRQEGWRLEPENLNDMTSNLVLKGVVFNEMKGVFVSFSDFPSVRIHQFQKTYQHIMLTSKLTTHY